MMNEAAADRHVTLTDVAAARNGRLFHQGPDDHYDQISAFIKSVRGSDADAGSTGSPACSRREKTPASSPGGW